MIYSSVTPEIRAESLTGQLAARRSGIAPKPSASASSVACTGYAEIDIQPPAGYEMPPPRVEEPVPQPLTTAALIGEEE